ncbi:MAG: glycosyltransferase family 9 protein [Armatimonadetes bacterium]|nr:glycosyltransferase family 9 protein [Armatimonadota bacterium]
MKIYQLGNIVKATPVLHGLKRRYPNCRITWLACAAGAKLLAHNPLVAGVLTDSAPDLLVARQRHWDLVLSLEADRRAAAIATAVPADRRLGFGLNPDGKLWPFGPESETLYALNLSNDLRFRANDRPIHEFYFDLLDLPYEGEEYLVCPSPQDFACADDLAWALGLPEGPRDGRKRPHSRPPIVGLNTGGNAARFETKQWTIDGFARLARMLHEQLGARVVLLGGPAEVARNAEILARASDCAVDSGCDHGILQFCAFLSRLDCVVSGDAFGLQAAVAMKTPVVGIFGPTPPQEIAVFGRGRKVTTALDCAPCYIRHARDCPRGADCMDLITPEEVLAATAAVLAEAVP